MTTDSRDRILRAANQVVERDGVARLTIDAVAREAGLSKGGVLYHFGTKRALVESMVAALLKGFDERFAEALAGDRTPGARIRAYIRASSHLDDSEAGVVIPLLAALATGPRLLDPARQQYDLWQRRLERDGLPPVHATILRLAIDGLWFADLFGLAPPSGQLRSEVLQTLLTMAEREDGSGVAGAADSV
jgi:AcrR family transcriptional regulator